MEAYRVEIANSAEVMAEKVPSMVDFLSRTGRTRRRGGRVRREAFARPTMALKSYLLQEAEAVSREAKIGAAVGAGLRVVSLQHDGIALQGVSERGRVAAVLSEAATRACGYEVAVSVEEVRAEAPPEAILVN